MKKGLCFALTLFVLVGLFNAAPAPVAAANETVSLKLYRPIFSNSPKGTAVEEEWERMMEEHLGVTLNITWEELSWSEYGTKMPVYMAAGEWADAFLFVPATDLPSTRINEYGEAGMLVNILDYLDEDDSYYLKMVNDSLRNKSAVTASDDGIYIFGETMVSYADGGTQANWAARFDVFEKHNIKIPESLSEMYDAAVELKKLYSDSYPIYIGGNDYNRWLSLYEASKTILWDGESYVFSPVRHADNIKTVITFLAKLYGEGLLDPEFITDSSDQINAKHLSDSIFMSSFTYHNRIVNIYNKNTENDVLWGMTNYPNRLDGSTGFRLSEHEIGVDVRGTNGIVINAKTKHPELLVKMCDYQYSPEMINLTNWGIEGVTYTVDKDGEYNYSDEILKADVPQSKLAEYGVNQSMNTRSGLLWLPQLNDSAIKLLGKVPAYYKGERIEDQVGWAFYSMTRLDEENVLPTAPARLAFNDDESELISIHKTALDTFVNEQLLMFITCERDISEFDDFIKEIANYGDYEAVEDLYNSKIIVE